MRLLPMTLTPGDRQTAALVDPERQAGFPLDGRRLGFDLGEVIALATRTASRSASLPGQRCAGSSGRRRGARRLSRTDFSETTLRPA